MEKIIEFNGNTITENEVEDISKSIIKILSQKNITHAIAYMILDKVKEELQNTIIKINV